MNSSDLFSHRDKLEVVSHAGRDSEPVQLPTFSDRPKSDSAGTTPARSRTSGADIDAAVATTDTR